MQSSLLMARGDRQGRENSDTWDMIIKIFTKGHYYIKISTVKTRRAYQYTLLYRDDSTTYFTLKLVNMRDNIFKCFYTINLVYLFTDI